MAVELDFSDLGPAPVAQPEAPAAQPAPQAPLDFSDLGPAPRATPSREMTIDFSDLGPETTPAPAPTTTGTNAPGKAPKVAPPTPAEISGLRKKISGATPMPTPATEEGVPSGFMESTGDTGAAFRNNDLMELANNYLNLAETPATFAGGMEQVFTREGGPMGAMPFLRGLYAAKGKALRNELLEKMARKEKLEPMEQHAVDAMALAQRKMSQDAPFWEKVGQFFGGSLPYMAEFGATSGIYSGVKGAAAAAGPVISRLAGVGAQAAVGGAGGIGENYLDRTAKSWQVDPKTLSATINDKQADKNALVELAKAGGDQYIEFLSERAGGPIAAGLGKLAAKVPKEAIVKLFRLGAIQDFMRRTGETAFAKAANAVKDLVGFHGVTGELAEEYIGNALRSLTGVDDEHNVLEALGNGDVPEAAKRFFGSLPIEETPAMAAAFGIIPGGQHAISAAIAGTQAAAKGVKEAGMRREIRREGLQSPAERRAAAAQEFIYQPKEANANRQQSTVAQVQGQAPGSVQAVPVGGASPVSGPAGTGGTGTAPAATGTTPSAPAQVSTSPDTLVNVFNHAWNLGADGDELLTKEQWQTKFGATFSDSEWQAIERGHADGAAYRAEQATAEAPKAEKKPTGKYSVYQYGSKWVVQQGEKPGVGDHLFDTEEEAKAATEQQQRMDKANAEFRAKQEAEEKERQRVEAEREAPVKSYLDTLGLEPMAAGNIKKSLSKGVSRRSVEKGKIYSGDAAKVVREMLDDGYAPTKSGDKHSLESPDGGFFYVSKTEYDYAHWLKEQKEAPKGKAWTPVKKGEVDPGTGARFDGEANGGVWRFTAFDEGGDEATTFTVKVGSSHEQIQEKYEATRKPYIDQKHPSPPREMAKEGKAPYPPKRGTPANPKWRVIVTAPVTDPTTGYKVPGWVQVDEISEDPNLPMRERDLWSDNPRSMLAKGWDISQKLYDLPQGRYTYGEALKQIEAMEEEETEKVRKMAAEEKAKAKAEEEAKAKAAKAAGKPGQQTMFGEEDKPVKFPTDGDEANAILDKWIELEIPLEEQRVRVNAFLARFEKEQSDWEAEQPHTELEPPSEDAWVSFRAALKTIERQLLGRDARRRNATDAAVANLSEDDLDSMLEQAATKPARAITDMNDAELANLIAVGDIEEENAARAEQTRRAIAGVKERKEAEKARKSARRPEGKKAKKPSAPTPTQSEWTFAGVNAKGEDVFQDKRGVRSVVRNGIRITEPVIGGVRTATDWEIVDKKQPAPKPAPAPAGEKSASQIAAQAVTEAAKGAEEALNAISKLLGGGTKMLSGVPEPSFDRKTYEAMKPHLNAAWQHFKNAGLSIPEFFQHCFKKFGEVVKPYLRQFILDLKSEIQAGNVESDVNKRPEGGGGGVGPGGAKPPTTGKTGAEGNAPPVDTGTSPEVQPGVGAPTVTGPAAGGSSTGGSTLPNVDDVSGGDGSDATNLGTGKGSGNDTSTLPANPPEPSSKDLKPPGKEPTNYYPEKDPAPTGLVSRVKANIEALKLIKKLQAEGRKRGDITPEEQKILASWSGWGSFKELFAEGRAARRDYDESWVRNYGENYEILRGLLDEKEFHAAAESSVNAHFTSQEVIEEGLWAAAERLGFRGGRALEPSAGKGSILAFTPKSLRESLKWGVIEMEPISGAIVGHLYPEADLKIMGFEDAKIPNAHYDLVITNVPFHEQGPGKEYPALNLHNYFIARSLDKVKPGGLVIVITTKNTLDARSEQRRFLASKGQLIAAIRLPNNAFKESAGTEVVTDILFLRKPDGTPFKGEAWENTGPVMLLNRQGNSEPYQLNEYFIAHPEMVLGQNSMTGKMYRREGEYTVIGSGELVPKIREAVKRLPEGILGEQKPSDEVQTTQLDDFTLVIGEAGRVMESQGYKLVKPDWDTTSTTLVRRAKDYIGLRDVLAAQYKLERDQYASESQMTDNRRKLNAKYKAWVKSHGTLNQNSKKTGYLSSDPWYYMVLALEDVREEEDPNNLGETITVVREADVLRTRMLMPDMPPVKAENATDALGVVMSYKGSLDMAEMRRLTGFTDEQIESELINANLAFKDPTSGLLMISQDYLSGEVRDKLSKAIFAAKESDAFKRNVEALKSVIPATIPFQRIVFDLTARWTPTSVLSQFAEEVLGLRRNSVTFVPKVEEFGVKAQDVEGKAKITWSTKQMEAPVLLQHALNFGRADIKVWDSDEEKYVRDEAGTALANQMIDQMKAEYVRWIRTTDGKIPYRIFDEERGEYRDEVLPIWDVMEREFNRKANSFVVPDYDGSMLKLPGMSANVRRTQHLLNGVMRAIVGGKAVFAHGVGSGKTFLFIAAAHELQRIGLAKKPVIVVKKPTVGQYRVSIERAYPGSRVLIPSKKDFKPENRQKLLARIASTKWDFIILTHENFRSISPGEDMLKGFYDEQIANLRQILADMGQSAAEDAKSTRGMDQSTRSVVRKLKALKKRLSTALEQMKKAKDKSKVKDNINWEDLGIDALFIDESHNFKKMPLVTQMEGEVRGIPSEFSQRAVDLLIKSRDVQRRTNGRNIFFASGTPVSNTLAELWIQFNATNPKLLEDFGISTFDGFASTYAEAVTEFELKWNNKFGDVTRLSRFKNPTGLTLLTRMGMDVKIGNKELGIKVPEMENGKPATKLIKPTPAFLRWAALLEQISDTWDSLDAQGRFFNSWVAIATMRAGVAAALDPRCVFPDAEDDPESKVNVAVREIVEEWKNGRGLKTTMMVFADMYRTLNTDKLMRFVGGEHGDPHADDREVDETEEPTATDKTEAEEVADDAAAEEDAFVKNAVGEFNLYEDIRAKLIAAGIPEREIAIITEHDTDARRESLFTKVRNGMVRILIGSTEKIGEGVDVPQRMSAQFHLDPPMQMTAAKLEQRFGRIIRQGNMHEALNLPVRVNLYAMERSMDAAIYQMLQFKATMTLQALKGAHLGDTFEDPASELTMAMAEIKAAATGDTRVLEMARLQKQVRELNMAEGAHFRRQSELRREADDKERSSNAEARAAVKYDKVAAAAAKVIEGGPEKVTMLHVRSQTRITGEKEIAEWLKALDASMVEEVKGDNKKEFVANLIFGDNLRVAFNIKDAGTANIEFKRSSVFYLGGPEPKWYEDPRWDADLSAAESILRVLNGLPDNAAARAESRRKDSAKDLAESKATREELDRTVFDRSDELREKAAQLRALEEALRPPPPPPRDPNAPKRGKKKNKPGAAPADEQASLAPEEQAAVETERPPVEAKSVDELRAVINDPASGLEPEAVALLNAFLDSPLAGTLEGIRVRITDALANGWQGSYFSGLVKLARNAEANTGIHEFGHRVWELLPQEIKDEFGRLRQESIAKEIRDAEAAGNEALAATLLDLSQGSYSSKEFQERGLPRRLYHYSSDEEFFTHSFSNRFQKKVGSQVPGFWGKVKEIWNSIVGMLRQVVGSQKTANDWLDKVIAGDFEITPETGAAVERREARGSLPNLPATDEALAGMTEEEMDAMLNEAIPQTAGLTLTDVEASGEIEQALAESGDPIVTEVFSRRDYVRGREQLTPAVIQAGQVYAKNFFTGLGLSVTQDDSGRWKLIDPDINQESVGRKMVDALRNEIANQDVDAPTKGYLANLLDSVVVNMTHDGVTAFSDVVKGDLYTLAQGERSHRGLLLGAHAHLAKSVEYTARNANVVLRRVYSDAFNGDVISKVLARMLTYFRSFFTDPEIDSILKQRPDLTDLVDKLISLDRKDAGGRLFKMVHAALKPKRLLPQKKLESNARLIEAFDDLMQKAGLLGYDKQPVLQKLSPREKLQLFVTPEGQLKIQELIDQAYDDAKRAAGIKFALMNAATPEERDALKMEFADGAEPTEEEIAQGLAMPEYKHWEALIENLIGYSPTSVKLAQELIKSDFTGTRFGKPIEKPADTKIDLMALARQPDAEVQRVFNAFLQDIMGNMDLTNATYETKRRVYELIERELTAQLQSARDRVLTNFFEPKKSAPKTASERFKALLNAGVSKDPRFQTDPVRQLVKRVATEHLDADQVNALATSTRAEKQQWIETKTDEIAAKENFNAQDPETREYLLAVVHTHLAERLQAAEERVTRFFLKGADATYHATPIDPAERERRATEARTKVEGLIRAGAFDTSMIEAIARKSTIHRLLPTINDLIKAVFETPLHTQDDLKTNFAALLVGQLGIDPAQADKAAAVFAQAFDARFTVARTKALEKAADALTPPEAKQFGPGTPLWQKIERFANAGGLDSGDLLKAMAKEHGWLVDDEKIAQLRKWVDEEERLRTPSRKELDAGVTPQEKADLTKERRAAIKKQIETMWSRLTLPLSQGSNAVAALYDFATANLLFKLFFSTRQLTDVVTQGGTHNPSRAVAEAFSRWSAGGRKTSLAEELGAALADSYQHRTRILKASLNSTKATLQGKADARNIDRLTSKIALFERAMQVAEERAKKGEPVQALILRLFSVLRYGRQFAAALDSLHGLPAVYQEMRQQVVSWLRENGKSLAEADLAADSVIGDFKAELQLGIERARYIAELNGYNYDETELKQAGLHLAISRAYQRMAEAGMPADDFRGRNEVLRETIGWNMREEGGVGGAIASLFSAAGKAGEKFPPLALFTTGLGRFGNAIGISANRHLSWAGLGLFPSAFGVSKADIDQDTGIARRGSPWFRTAEDRRQRKVEAVTGMAMGAVAVILVATGAVTVRLRWPKDKEERELLESTGHKLGTIEFNLPDGQFIPVSLTVGPASLAAPYFAGAGAAVELLNEQQKKQDALNARAEKLGITPGKAKPLGFGDLMYVAGQTAWGSIVGGRTAAGLIGSLTDYGIPNASKSAAALVSPIVPALPAYQELTRALGLRMNNGLAGFWDFLVPLPTSGARAVNMLGQPAGTPDAIQSIIQVATGGTYGIVNEKALRERAGYQALFESGYRPPSINPGKGYQFGQDFRPMTEKELTDYTVKRGQFFAEELLNADPSDKESVKNAYTRANLRALEAVGASSPRLARSTGRGASASASSPASASTPGGGSIPSQTRIGQSRVSAVRGLGIRGGSLRPRNARVGGRGRVGRGRRSGARVSLRPGRGGIGGRRRGVRRPSRRY
jgi:N12 class adenine-specific DNA methylase